MNSDEDSAIRKARTEARDMAWACWKKALKSYGRVGGSGELVIQNMAENEWKARGGQ